MIAIWKNKIMKKVQEIRVYKFSIKLERDGISCEMSISDDISSLNLQIMEQENIGQSETKVNQIAELNNNTIKFHIKNME